MSKLGKEILDLMKPKQVELTRCQWCGAEFDDVLAIGVCSEYCEEKMDEWFDDDSEQQQADAEEYESMLYELAVPMEDML